MLPQISSNKVFIDKSPIKGDLKALPAISLLLASGSQFEPLWDQLVKNYHYLGYRNLLGHRLKYIAFSGGRPVAALSWSAPALKLLARDAFIGWSAEQRKTNLKRIVNNSRFLILPWVNVSCLASHLLSLNIRCLKKDWIQRFNEPLWLLETFVDPTRFKGICYKAANWRCLGLTFGSRKQGAGYQYHGIKKEIYVYVLDSNFRKQIGCKQKIISTYHRPSPTIKKVKELQMILRHTDWDPNIEPCMKLTEKDLGNIADELVTFHGQFQNCFGRTEHQRLSLAYISGLLSNSHAKSVEPIALEFLEQKSVRSLQRFMKTYIWDQEKMEARHQVLLSEMISSAGGMINLDSSEFLKKGKESVGVVRQYCGEAGKVENCQSGVFIGYASSKGYGLLTSQLYMPKTWFSDEYEQRRKETLVPQDLKFQTKPQIALELINNVLATGLFPAKWFGCDSTFGSDENFLKSLPSETYYFANIRSNTKVFSEKAEIGIPPYQGKGPRPKKTKVLSGQPQPMTVKQLIESHNMEWSTVILAEGSKGPIIADIAAVRVYLSRNGLPEDSSSWLFIRRTADGQIKQAISNAPKNIPLSQLCEAATMRWPIEQCFQEGKSNLGMGDYEHRSWPAWHRHMTYVFLAHQFLLQLRLNNKKKLLQ